jgi:hypothetical protein
MDTLRDVFLVLAALLTVGGAAWVIALEFGSSAERRLVSRLRDALEVLLPAVLVTVLVAIVWLETL